MDKFNRNYILTVQGNDGTTITIKPPFTLEFDIDRNSMSSASVGQVRIYNLSAKTRSQIRKDSLDFADLRFFKLRAGYGDNLATIFAGNISQAWSVRQGVDMITTIECYDGGGAFANAQVSKTFPAGTTNRQAMEYLVDQLKPYGVTPGAIGDYPNASARGSSVVGSPTELLQQMSAGGFFIDNSKANVLNDTEYIEGEIMVINAKSGLLGTPLRERTFINFDMLFEPKLYLYQQIKLESQTAETFNGFYKVVGIKHRGTISESVAGNAITSVQLLSFKKLTPVQSRSGNG